MPATQATTYSSLPAFLVPFEGHKLSEHYEIHKAFVVNLAMQLHNWVRCQKTVGWCKIVVQEESMSVESEEGAFIGERPKYGLTSIPKLDLRQEQIEAIILMLRDKQNVTILLEYKADQSVSLHSSQREWLQRMTAGCG